MKGRPPKLYSHGGQSLTLREWAKVTGVSFWCLQSRLRYGWPLEKVLSARLHTKPKRRQRLVALSAEQIFQSWISKSPPS
jgi:hypothetical protein